MLSALSAALLFCACTPDPIEATVIPLGTNESYTVSDTAIVYNLADDTTRMVFTYRIVGDTVRETAVQHIFDENYQATSFMQHHLDDPEMHALAVDNRTVYYSLDSYNGLTARNVVDILEDEYLYSETYPDSIDTEREFSIRSFGDLQDGMYFMLTRKLTEGRLLLHSNSMVGEWLGFTYVNERTHMPWRLLQATPSGWYIQLGNGDYLRRTGNLIAPLALTATSSQELATVWNVEDIVRGLNFWTIHSASSDPSVFYGATTEDGDILRVVPNSLETFSMLVNHVKLTFSVAGETWTTLSSLWGCSVPLPSFTETHEGATFIGWNTVENTVEGYLLPGTLVPADQTTYYAVFVKTE